MNPAELLQWYAEIGVDEAIGEETLDRLRIVEKPAIPAAVLSMMPAAAAIPAPQPMSGTIEALAEARALAESATTLEELQAAIAGFDGLAIRRTASNMVFADGDPTARVMLVGDAPAADDDRAGKPFMGINGQLLDKMIGAIGLSRESSAYVTNVLNWYPPGGRAPSEAEIALSLPFVRRHIELVNPAVLVVVGGPAAKALLETGQSIMRLRGKWLSYGAIPAMALFHPAYLIGSPAQKGLAWADLLMLKEKLQELAKV